MIEIEAVEEVGAEEEKVGQPSTDVGWVRKLLESYLGKVGAVVAAVMVVLAGVGGFIGGTHLFRSGVNADLANTTEQVNAVREQVNTEVDGFDRRLDAVELDVREMQTIVEMMRHRPPRADQ